MNRSRLWSVAVPSLLAISALAGADPATSEPPITTPTPAPAATPGDLSPLLAPKVTLRAQDRPLAEVLSALQRQTGIAFSMDLSQDQRSRPVTVDAHQETLGQVLADLLMHTTLIAQIEDHAIIVMGAKTLVPTATYCVTYPVKDLLNGITPKPAPQPTPLQEFAEILECVVAPRTWKTAPHAREQMTIMEDQALLVVTHTGQTQTEIASVLQALRTRLPAP